MTELLKIVSFSSTYQPDMRAFLSVTPEGFLNSENVLKHLYHMKIFTYCILFKYTIDRFLNPVVRKSPFSLQQVYKTEQIHDRINDSNIRKVFYVNIAIQIKEMI